MSDAKIQELGKRGKRKASGGEEEDGPSSFLLFSSSSGGKWRTAGGHTDDDETRREEEVEMAEAEEEEKQDPLGLFGSGIMTMILSKLDARSVALGRLVSRGWLAVASSDDIWAPKGIEMRIRSMRQRWILIALLGLDAWKALEQSSSLSVEFWIF